MSTVLDRNTPVKRRASERLRIKCENESNGPGQGRAEGGGMSVRDQIIIAPEIMKTILEKLDVRTLKRVRLVCKSWLLEAQSHLERRGKVWLSGCSESSARIPEFMETMKNKIPALPQPFSSIDVNLDYWKMLQGMQAEPPAKIRDLNQLSKFKLSPQLAITRISTNGLPLKYTLSLIMQWSSSLEHLCLRAIDSDEGFRIPRKNKDVKFQKLQSLDVNAYLDDDDNQGNGYAVSQLVPWIMKASPKINSFEITALDYDEEEISWLANKVLSKVDLGNITTLNLDGIQLDHATAQHLVSTSFSKLQNLRLEWVTGEAVPQVLLAIMAKAAGTLTKLKFGSLLSDAIYEVDAEFPVCPNVQKLSFCSFPYFTDLIERGFPSLKDFDANCSSDIGDEQHLKICRPLVGVKTLRLLGIEYRSGSFKPTTLFAAFPALESLHIHESFLFKYSRMMSKGEINSLDLLQGLKHLKLDPNWTEDANDIFDYSWLVQLKALETLTLSSFCQKQILRIPVAEMPSLRVLRFKWWRNCNGTKQLLELIKVVDRVEITNCCSGSSKEWGSQSKDLLEKFFDSAPNVVCGCKKYSDGKF